MATLVNYGSSDEDEEQSLVEASSAHNVQKKKAECSPVSKSNGRDTEMPDAAPSANKLEPAVNGDIQGPAAAPSTQPLNSSPGSAPSSPYSANRNLIRDLTLPTIPNLDIPPSPPGSPPPGLEKKLEHFLELKKQGVHFNEKLAKSSALKNPSLMGKLMKFAGLEDGDQYATTLPKNLWDPAGFPAWTYKDQLAKTQTEAQKQRDEQAKTRDHVDFVAAKVPEASVKAGSRGSAAERVMAGLNRDKTRSQRRSRSR